MNVIAVVFCLFCAIFANPIPTNKDFEPSELYINSTEPSLLVQASGNETSEVESSESSESVESASSNSTSGESNSAESSEHTEMLVETRDDSMGSEENVRKSWVRVFATVVQDSSVEDNSTEVKSPQTEILNKLAEKEPVRVPMMKSSNHSDALVSLLQRAMAASDSSSESAESLVHTVTADSVQSLSSESNETSSSSEASDSASSRSSQSGQDSDDSDSAEPHQIRHCANGTRSCESHEYFFQDVGDDANFSVDNMMVPDMDDRELSLRR